MLITSDCCPITVYAAEIGGVRRFWGGTRQNFVYALAVTRGVTQKRRSAPEVCRIHSISFSTLDLAVVAVCHWLDGGSGFGVGVLRSLE
jgi:hypothetical protein